ncbi:MAG: hypothetical protein HUU20_29010, partial [Pirellulales bacterium]|nr:hypothetical protein [Pirellulales bacterium]
TAGSQAAPTAAPSPKHPPRRTAARRSAGDHLSDPGPALTGQLAAAVALCRQSRSPLSLLIVDPADSSELFLTLGSDEYDRFRRFLEAACRTIDPSALCLPNGEAGFAVVLPGFERQAAVRMGNQLIDQVRRLPLRSAAGSRRAASLAVGAATVSLPPKNFPPDDLFSAANRCLYGSRLSGGGVVKSIEIY